MLSLKERKLSDMNIGEKIRLLRTQKNITVNKLATQAGISQSFLRDIELGNKKPSVEILSYICEALQISLKDFFDDDVITSISDDPLIRRIYQLSPEQRSALLLFLNTLE